MPPASLEQLTTTMPEAFSPQYRRSAAGKRLKNGGDGPKLRIPSPQGSDEEGDEDNGTGGGADHSCGERERDDEEEENMGNVGTAECENAPDHERFQRILNSFTPDQANRYESYRRSGFQRSKMLRLLACVAAGPVSDHVAIAMSGISKIFVGELVETGRMVMRERNHEGPLRPCHIREAYRRLKVEGKVPSRGRAPRFR